MTTFDMPLGTAAELARLAAEVHARCGLVFEAHGNDKLAQAMGERMGLLGIARAADYLPRVIGDATEFQALVNLLTINETYFFREPAQIELLVERIVPRLLAARGDGRPLTILSAGCSSGEEPYSLVMALTEKYGSAVPGLFRFLAGDIDSAVLARARGGRYGRFSFRGVPAAMQQRYFEPEGAAFRLDREIRDQVRFLELNLLAAQLPAELDTLDVIFFRNVSIYFDAPTRRRILERFARRLSADGVLLVGTAETIANDFGVLPLREESGLFYFSRAGAPLRPAPQVAARPWVPPPVLVPPLIAPTPMVVMPPPVVPAAVVTDAGPAPTVEAIRALLAGLEFDAAAPLLERLLAQSPQSQPALLLKAFVLINRKDFAGAGRLAEVVNDASPWSVDALLLRGLAAKWQQQAEAALGWFKAAVYTCQHCWPAHYYLAELYRQRDETELARRAYRTVLQCLDHDEAATGLEVVPLGLPAGEIRFLCRHQLERLGGTRANAGRP